jgi:GTP-binding protein
MIGVVDFADYRRATVADIPGLIEGAHRNLGSGTLFCGISHAVGCFSLFSTWRGARARNPAKICSICGARSTSTIRAFRSGRGECVANKMDSAEAEQNLADFRQRFPDKESNAGVSERSRMGSLT